MERPLISVVIPTWNSAGYLPATLDSILGQTWPRVEIILVDDGSTDDTETVLANYTDRVIYLRQENWGGPSRPRNAAIARATGDYIAFFDSDDLMDSEKLAAAAAVLQAHPEVDFTFTNFREIDEHDAVLTPDFLAAYQNFRRVTTFPEGPDVGYLTGREAYSELLAANFVGTSSVICRRNVFTRVGPFDETMLNADDVDMWRRIAYAGSGFAFINRVLHSYRKREGGVTMRGAARRLPAVLKSMRKQLDLDLSPGERQLVSGRINEVLVGYGHGLCAEGNFGEAGKIFREALGQQVSPGAVKGLLKATFRWRGRD